MEDLQEEPELEEEEQQQNDEEEEEDEEEDSGTISNGKQPQTPPVSSTNGKPKPKTGRKPLLQTNFSVTGLNEIKTECIPSEHDHRIVLKCDISADSGAPPTRPVSLHLNSTFTTFKPPVPARPESVHLEKVTTKMIDSENNH